MWDTSKNVQIATKKIAAVDTKHPTVFNNSNDAMDNKYCYYAASNEEHRWLRNNSQKITQK